MERVKYNPDAPIVNPPVTPWSPGAMTEQQDFFDDGPAIQSPLLSPIGGDLLSVDGDELHYEQELCVPAEGLDGSDHRHIDGNNNNDNMPKTWPFLKPHAARIVYRGTPKGLGSRDSSSLSSASKHSTKKHSQDIVCTPAGTLSSQSMGLSSGITSTTAIAKEPTMSELREETPSGMPLANSVVNNKTVGSETPTNVRFLSERQDTDISQSEKDIYHPGYRPETDYRVSWRSWHSLPDYTSAPPPTASSTRNSNSPFHREKSAISNCGSSRGGGINNTKRETDGLHSRSHSQCSSPRIPDVIQKQLNATRRPPSHLITANRRFSNDSFEKTTWGDVIRIKSCNIARETEQSKMITRFWDRGDGRHRSSVQQGKDSFGSVPLSDELRGILAEDRKTLRRSTWTK